jgi:hypothetical protein
MPRRSLRLALGASVGLLGVVGLVLGFIVVPVITTALSDEASAGMYWGKVAANLLLIAGAGILDFYEILIAVPILAGMAVPAFAAFFFFGTRIFSGGTSAGRCVTGITGFLIITGGALLADEGHRPGGTELHRRLVRRLRYRVIDSVESLFPRPRPQAVSGLSAEGA